MARMRSTRMRIETASDPESDRLISCHLDAETSPAIWATESKVIFEVGVMDVDGSDAVMILLSEIICTFN